VNRQNAMSQMGLGRVVHNQGHSRPTHSVPLPINVRCYSNNDIVVRRSEMTLRADFVEEVGRRFEMNQPGHSKALDFELADDLRLGEDLASVSASPAFEVLSGCCEKELISRTIRPS
jgi:hypothetical protein